MRKEYGKAFRAQFSRLLPSYLPGFQEEKVGGSHLWAGERAYLRRASESLWCWLVLSPDPKARDRFTVELGWSRLGRFPELPTRPSLPAFAGDDIYREDERMDRLAGLWSDHDPWWELPRRPASNSIPSQEALVLVEPAVIDALTRLREHAPSYFAPLLANDGG